MVGRDTQHPQRERPEGPHRRGEQGRRTSLRQRATLGKTGPGGRPAGRVGVARTATVKEARGQHADGLQAYDQCRRLFAAELGCAPGPGLQEVYVRLLRGANEDNKELSQLLDAVVRLHMASQQGTGPTGTALDSGISQAVDRAGSVEQAFTSLNLLLRSVGGRRGHVSEVLGT